MSKALGYCTLLAILLASGLPACMRTRAADPQRVALEAAITRWTAAINAQDAHTLSTTMTADVELMDPAGTVAGRDAAVRLLREAASRGKLVATTRDLTLASDAAWRTVLLVQIQKNGDVQARGQALEIWKRVNGDWMLHRRMASEGAAPGIPLTRPSTNEPVLDRPKD